MNKKSDDTVEFYIDHETRIRILENAVIDINRKLDALDSKIDNKFNLVTVLIITSIILPIGLHALHWI